MNREEADLLRRIAKHASDYFHAKADPNWAHRREVGGVKGCHERMRGAVVDWENYTMKRDREVAKAKSVWAAAKCEVCGAQAVVQVFDMERHENLATGMRKMSPFGRPHVFCNEHKRDSLYYETGPR